MAPPPQALITKGGLFTLQSSCIVNEGGQLKPSDPDSHSQWLGTNQMRNVVRVQLLFHLLLTSWVSSCSFWVSWNQNAPKEGLLASRGVSFMCRDVRNIDNYEIFEMSPIHIFHSIDTRAAADSYWGYLTIFLPVNRLISPAEVLSVLHLISP